MGKHTKRNYTKLKTICTIAFIILFITLVLIFVLPEKIFQKGSEEIKSINKSENTKAKNDTLILESKINENKKTKIYFEFEKGILKSISSYEKYNSNEEYEKKKSFYEANDNYEIINVNNEELAINYRKKDIKSEEGLTYQEVYDKYMGIIRSI